MQIIPMNNERKYPRLLTEGYAYEGDRLATALLSIRLQDDSWLPARHLTHTSAWRAGI